MSGTVNHLPVIYENIYPLYLETSVTPQMFCPVSFVPFRLR